MGIQYLNQIISSYKETIPINKLYFFLLEKKIISQNNKYAVIAVDGNLYSCKFKYGSGTPYTKLLNFIWILTAHNIIPLFIFDGQTCPEKISTVKKRYLHKKKQECQLNDIEKSLKETKERLKNLDDLNIEEKDKLKNKINQKMNKYIQLKKNVEIIPTNQEIQDIFVLLNLLGLPVLSATFDGESYAVALNRKHSNIINGVMSDDTDLFPFGAKTVISNFDFRRSTVDVSIQSELLKKINLNYNQLVDMSILLGSDYLTTESGNKLKISGIGPKTVYKFMLTYGSIEKIFEEIKKNKLKYKIPPNFDYQIVRKLFKSCNGDLDNWDSTKIKKIVKFTLNKNYVQTNKKIYNFIAQLPSNTIENKITTDKIVSLLNNIYLLI